MTTKNAPCLVTKLDCWVKAIAPNGCILSEVLVAKRLTEHTKTTLEELVKIINFINSQPLQLRLFEAFNKKMGKNHVQLLFHTFIQWYY